MDKKNNSSFAIGVLIGAVATYLFTTPNGRKIKDELTREGFKLLDKLADGLSDLEEEKEKLQKKALKEASDVKDEIQESLSEKVEEAESNIQEVAEDVPEHIEQLQKKGRHFFFKKTPRGES